MPAVPKLDVDVVRKFHPFDSQSIKKVKEIIHKSTVQKLPADRILFQYGDNDEWTIYLLSGKIKLKLPDGKTLVIEADTESAMNSISNQIPRVATATSQTDISILIIDRSLLQVILNHNDGGIEVGNIDDDDNDWMTHFLQSNAFLQLPAANIQALMMRLHAEHLSAGSVVIKENSPSDDKFYIIQEGTCLVTKTNQFSGKKITLAQLGYGTGVGEEALITGGVRCASVIMETDGIIMTLEKKDFLDLLVEPIIHRIKKSDLQEYISTSDSLLVDIRSENEFKNNQLDNTAYNIPIQLIRSQLEQLDHEKHYIVYSNNESRSSAAAFLFIQQGFYCSILEGGIGDKAESVKISAKDQTAVEELPLIAEVSSDIIQGTEISDFDKIPVLEKTSDTDKSLSEQLSDTKDKYKKLETLAAALKAKAQEAIKFAQLKNRQLELVNQKLKAEIQRADNTEALLKQSLAEIEQLKQ